MKITSVTNRIFLILLTSLLLAWPATAGERERLTLGMLPFLAATELFDHFTPLTSYLSERLGAEVTLEIFADYEMLIEKIGYDQVEIAFLGPAPYIRLVELHGSKPILARLETDGTPTFQGVIFVRREAPFTRLADLKGRRFAFGDPQSTMSHVLPRHMLLKAGIDLDDLASFDFISNHHNVVLGVLLGDFDAGAVKEDVFYEYEARGLRALAETPPISELLFVASATLPAETVAALRQSLLELGESAAGLEILTGIQPNATGLVPAADEDYHDLRGIMLELEKAGVMLD
jgi:phosphonate transport system substrate-binding protein